MSRHITVRLNEKTCCQMIANLSEPSPPITGTPADALLQKLTMLLPLFRNDPELEARMTVCFSDHLTGKAR